MSHFCPGCGNAVGFDTLDDTGCPVCGTRPEELEEFLDLDEDEDEDPEQ